jgi:hypothetical protein
MYSDSSWSDGNESLNIEYADDLSLGIDEFITQDNSYTTGHFGSEINLFNSNSTQVD